MINRCLWNVRKADRTRRMGFIAMGCFLLMAGCIACASHTYGKYLQSESKTFDGVNVAVMRTTVSTKSINASVNNLNSPSGRTVNFQVKKQVTTDKKSEVSFSYSIFLNVPNDFPDYLSVDLYDDNTTTKVAEGKIDIVDQQKIITFDKTFYFLPSDKTVAKNYKLEFTVTDLAAVPIGGRTINDIIIYVHFEQIQSDQIPEGA